MNSPQEPFGLAQRSDVPLHWYAGVGPLRSIHVPQYPVAVAGILRAGFVVVNVNPLYTPRELEHQLNDAGVETILGALSVAIQLSGARPVGRLHVEDVALETQADRVEVGGHVGACHGWTGRVTLLCNAPTVYALRLAESLGLGGKTAYGLGRVRVSVERVDGRSAAGRTAKETSE